MTERYRIAELVHEFEWTRPRHGGSILAAAEIIGMLPQSLCRSLERWEQNTGRKIERISDHRRVSA